MLGLPGGLPGILTCGVGWGVSTLVFMCTHGTLLVCWCVHMVRGVGWGGVCQRWCSCVHMVRCWCVDVYTWYAADVFMCTHGALLVCSCVHMVRCWCVDVYTWYVGWGGVGCVNVGVHVYTWYAAGVLMCTHGTLLVCWCVHMVRCWCVHVYTWYAAGVLMCTHGTWGGVHVPCLIVHRFLILIGFNVFLLAMCLLSVWLFLFTSGVCDIYIYMYVYFMSVYICMQIVSNGNAVNYRWLLIFPPDLAKKSSLDIVKTFNDQLHLKKKIWSLLVNNHILYEKTQWNQHHDYKNNKRLRILITCSHSRPCSKPGKPPRRSQHVASILLVVYRISLAHLQYFARSIYMEMWNPWLHDNSTHGGHHGTQKTAGHVQVRFRSSLAIWHVLVLGFQGVGTLGFGS